MAFTTAPAKAARAAAVARAAAKANQERGEEEEAESSLSEINSSGTQSTIAEVHEEDDPVANLKTSSGQQCVTTATYKFQPKSKSTLISRGLSYTSLWPSAKDVVISAAPPNTCPDT